MWLLFTANSTNTSTTYSLRLFVSLTLCKKQAQGPCDTHTHRVKNTYKDTQSKADKRPTLVCFPLTLHTAPLQARQKNLKISRWRNAAGAFVPRRGRLFFARLFAGHASEPMRSAANDTRAANHASSLKVFLQRLSFASSAASSATV